CVYRWSAVRYVGMVAPSHTPPIAERGFYRVGGHPYLAAVRDGTLLAAPCERIFAISRKRHGMDGPGPPLLGAAARWGGRARDLSTKVVPELLHCVTSLASNSGRSRALPAHGVSQGILEEGSHVRPVPRQARVRRERTHRQGRI